MSLALGAEATFVARTIDSDRKHLTEVLRQAAAHEGAALVEIYQNCNIFNDGAWEPLKDNDTRDDVMMRLVHGEPIRFGKDNEKGVIRTADGHIKVARRRRGRRGRDHPPRRAREGPRTRVRPVPACPTRAR